MKIRSVPALVAFSDLSRRLYTVSRVAAADAVVRKEQQEVPPKAKSKKHQPAPFLPTIEEEDCMYDDKEVSYGKKAVPVPLIETYEPRSLLGLPNEKPWDKEYSDLVYEARGRFPNLVFLYEELDRHVPRSISRGRGRVSMLEKLEGKPWTCLSTFTSATKMERFLDVHGPMMKDCKERLFILEDISKPFIQALAERYNYHIDPSFLASHLRMRHQTHILNSNAPTLESLSSQGKSFSIQYYELHLGLSRKYGQDSLLFCDSNVHRRILVADTRVSGLDGNLAVVPRQATFWSHEFEPHKRTMFLLLDPAIGEAVYLHPKGKHEPGVHVPLQHKAFYPPSGQYQGGYLDFEPWPIPPQTCTFDNVSDGPERSSALGDFLFYLQRERGRNTQRLNHDWAMAIVQKIALSHWITLIEYLRHKIYQLEGITEHGDQLDDLEFRKEIYSWRRNCMHFIEEVESSMRSVTQKLPSQELNHTPDLNPQWHFVLGALRSHQQRIDALIQTSIGLLSIKESQKSFREAKDVTLLTRFGMLFLPLSYSTGLFSMAPDFAPGASNFWIYFAVAIPLVLLVLCIISVQDIWATMVKLFPTKHDIEQSITSILERYARLRGHRHVLDDLERGSSLKDSAPRTHRTTSAKRLSRPPTKYNSSGVKLSGVKQSRTRNKQYPRRRLTERRGLPPVPPIALVKRGTFQMPSIMPEEYDPTRSRISNQEDLENANLVFGQPPRMFRTLEDVVVMQRVSTQHEKYA